MIPRLSAVKEGINLYGATEFSPFEIFSPDENTLSRVVAELFDPKGSHGQGLLFINGLLTTLNRPRIGALEPVKVRREVLTRNKRRIDIVVETPRYVIGIENKPWAIQQKDQLSDYLAELKSDLHGRQAVLVFLSNQEAKTGGNEVDRVPYFVSLHEGYSLHSILLNLVDSVCAVRPKHFVEDFVRYLEVNFGDAYVESASDMPFIDAVSGEFDDLSRRKAIASVLLSQEKLHARILDEIGDYLLSEVRAKVNADFEPESTGKGYDATLSECLWVRWVMFGLRRPEWPQNCHVGLEAYGSNWLEEIKFGVRAPDGGKLPAKEHQSSSPARDDLDDMHERIPGGKKDVYWAWYKILPQRYWGQEFCARIVLESPSGRVQDHPDIQEIALHLVDLASEVDRVLKS